MSNWKVLWGDSLHRFIWVQTLVSHAVIVTKEDGHFILSISENDSILRALSLGLLAYNTTYSDQQTGIPVLSLLPKAGSVKVSLPGLRIMSHLYLPSRSSDWQQLETSLVLEILLSKKHTRGKRVWTYNSHLSSPSSAGILCWNSVGAKEPFSKF